MVEIDGEPWFVAVDVTKHLGLSRHGGVLAPLSRDEKTKRGRTSLGMAAGRDVNLISESGLYKLVMRSDKKEAKQFQEWVTREVLPAIRKTGTYTMPGAKKAIEAPQGGKSTYSGCAPKSGLTHPLGQRGVLLELTEVGTGEDKIN